MSDRERPAGLQPVEILHIDTQGSRTFFLGLDVSPAEKDECQKVLLNLFSECCQQAGGFVAANWAGDRGDALFPAQTRTGGSVASATDFIARPSLLAQRTAIILGRVKPDAAGGQVRIKAHFGLVFLSGGGSTDSGAPADFDDFFKNERQFAPETDEPFITDQLRKSLGLADNARFEI